MRPYDVEPRETTVTRPVCAGDFFKATLHDVVRVEHDGPLVRAVVFADVPSAPCDAIVKTGNLGQTHLPGLYVVGDASRDVQFAIVAAAEGAKAAVAINKALQARAGLVPESASSEDPAHTESGLRELGRHLTPTR